jgi:hypothetical protein
MRADGGRLAIVTLNVDRSYPGAPGGFDVTPSVSYADAARQIEVESLGGVQQQAWLGLATHAGVAVVVRAYADFVQRHEAAQPFVHPVDLGACLPAPGDIGLIGHHDQDEPSPPQFRARLRDTR